MNKKIPAFLSIFLCLLAIPSFGQFGWDSRSINTRSRFFFGLTYSIIPDIEKGPIKIYPNYVNYYTALPPYPQQGEAVTFVFNTNFVSLGTKLRYNLIQFTHRMSLSLSFIPSVGVGFTVIDEPDVGKINPYPNCSYNLPVMLEFNYGNFATRRTSDEYGIFAFTGLERTGLFLKNDNSDGAMMDAYGNFYAPDFIRNWTEAVAGLGVRYKNSRHVEREVFLKYGIGQSKYYVTPLEQIESTQSWTLKLTLVRNF